MKELGIFVGSASLSGMTAAGVRRRLRTASLTHVDRGSGEPSVPSPAHGRTTADAARALSEMELTICRALGVDREQYLKARDGSPDTAPVTSRGIPPGALTETELTVCRRLGLDPEEYLKTRAAML